MFIVFRRLNHYLNLVNNLLCVGFYLVSFEVRKQKGTEIRRRQNESSVFFPKF